ncbi:MAG: hypothetical protein P8Y97_13010 [Candidatus Lokiarchaeota archaeon]
MSDQKIYYTKWPQGVPKEIVIPEKTLVDFFEESVKKFPLCSTPIRKYSFIYCLLLWYFKDRRNRDSFISSF